MKDSKERVISPSFVPSSFCLFTDVATGLLRQGHGVRFYAKGWSMYPTIKDGEMITVEPVVPSQVKRGDILLHHNGRGVIAHRVVRIERKKRLFNTQNLVFNTFFILRGDGSSTCDEPVEADQALGKVVSVERNGRLFDLDGWKSIILHTAHLYGSRFKMSIIQTIRWMRTHLSNPKYTKLFKLFISDELR
jgi:signal peptidase I